MFEGLRERFGSHTTALTVHAFQELQPGPRWQALFEALWPAYRDWFLREGDAARPGYVECRRALHEHLPELVPTWEALTELAGGGDVAARMLSGWTPPRFVSGCSQLAWAAPDGPVLVRNYDYAASQFEGVVASTGYAGRRVIGTTDLLWGLLDGINDAGLAVSITFGGRRQHGRGFGIAVVVRYLLQTCETAEQVARTLARLPLHFSYNVTGLDAAGTCLTTFVRPDRPALIKPQPQATNHQEEMEWPEYGLATRSVEREQRLCALLAEHTHMTVEDAVAAFHTSPLYGSRFREGYGTLYTAVLQPARGCVEYRWPGVAWRHSLADFEAGQRTVLLRSPRGPLGRSEAAGQ